jgi:hypothetical protein
MTQTRAQVIIARIYIRNDEKTMLKHISKNVEEGKTL